MTPLRGWLAGPRGGMLLAVALAALLRLPALDSIPPGFSFDEAGNGVAALDVAQGQYRLWWSIGGGKEPLMAYVVQLLFWLMGPTPLALRLYAASMGVVTVAGAYWLAWEMFSAPLACKRDDETASPSSRYLPEGALGLIPLFSALGLATAFWHVALSRIAFRALAMPAIEVLAVAWLWRVLRSGTRLGGVGGRWRHFVGAGFLIGLGPYTYLTGRFLPVALALFLVAESLLAWLRGERPLLLHHFWGLGLSAVVATLVFSPLALFFLRHPEAFVERAGTVSIFNPAWNQGDLTGTLLRTTLNTVGTFAALTGDPNIMGNLAGRPMLGPVLAPFFWLGVLVCIWRVVRSPPKGQFTSEGHYLPQRQRVPMVSETPTSLPNTSTSHAHSPNPFLFLICWWSVMLLPGILAPENAPHHLRLIGTAPVTYTLVAIGLAQTVLLTSVSPRISTWRVRRTMVSWLVLLLFLVIGLATARDYFARWARRPELYMAYDVYAVELAEQMAMETESSVVYVVPMDLRAGHEARHYTLDFLYRTDTPYFYLPVDASTVTDRLTQIAAGHTTLRVVRWLQDKHAAADEREVVTFLLAREAQLTNEEFYPVYRVETWRLPSARTVFALPAITTEVGATFDALLRLEAADVSVRDEVVAIALRWVPLGIMDADYKASLRLIGTGGHVASQKDRLLRHNWHQGTSQWPLETVSEYYLLPTPGPGEYDLQVVVYDSGSLEVLSADGRPEVSLGKVGVK